MIPSRSSPRSATKSSLINVKDVGPVTARERPGLALVGLGASSAVVSHDRHCPLLGRVTSVSASPEPSAAICYGFGTRPTWASGPQTQRRSISLESSRIHVRFPITKANS